MIYHGWCMITHSDLKNKLLGQWALEAYENIQASGASILMTQGQEGTLRYTSSGFVYVSIRRDAETLRKLGLSARLSEIFYRGRYEVDSEKAVVIHHVDESNEPERVGKSLERKFQLMGQRLEITGRGLEGDVKLIWRRTSDIC